jgi:hypothetical protein
MGTVEIDLWEDGCENMVWNSFRNEYWNFFSGL